MSKDTTFQDNGTVFAFFGGGEPEYFNHLDCLVLTYFIYK